MTAEELVSHLQQIDDIEKYSVGIFIRHAAREAIVSGKDAHLAPLTSVGREAARKLGQAVSKWPLAGVYTSIVERCVDTGDCIIEGSNSKVKGIAEPMLATGFIDDWNTAKIAFSQRDPEQIIFDYLSGEVIAGFSSIPEGSERMLTFIRSHSIPGALTFFVTHDALIMPFQQHFLGTQFSQENWTPFLGSAIVMCRNDQVFINGQQIISEMKDD